MQARQLHLRKMHVASLRPVAVVDALQSYAVEDPDFLLELASAMLTLTTSGPDSAGIASGGREKLPPLAQAGMELLDHVVAFAPAITQAYILKARGYLSFDKVQEAQMDIQRCLQVNERHTGAHLLEAQIAVTQNDWRGTEHAIEEALASDFSVRSCPLYKLVRSSLLSKQVTSLCSRVTPSRSWQHWHGYSVTACVRSAGID